MNADGWSEWPAPAKLNLFLHITGRRLDGMHCLQSVFRLLEWGDQVGVRVRSGTITFPAAGAAKQLACKIKTDEAAADVWAWSIRIIRTS